MNLRARQAVPRDWNLAAAYRVLVLVFRLPGKSLPRWRTRPGMVCATLPDADNYLKAVKDALKGVCWHDDGQVYDARCVKLYAAEHSTRVWVEWVEHGSVGSLAALLSDWSG